MSGGLAGGADADMDADGGDAPPRLGVIVALRLTTAIPERLAVFYAALGFAVGARRPVPADELARLGLGARAAGSTRTSLSLPGRRLTLDLDHFPGALAPYPRSATGADTVSRHPALVVANARAAWAVALAAGAVPVSDNGPVVLPAAAGGVTAVKFRDPEGHPLEFLQFPAGSVGAARWGLEGSDGDARVRGIDHLAMAVADTAHAAAFFARLGLVVEPAGLNHGPTQAALDGLPDPRVAVVPIRVPGRLDSSSLSPSPSDATAEPNTNLELLGYHRPPGRQSGPVAPTDIASLCTVWTADRDALLRDPSGHLHLLRRA